MIYLIAAVGRQGQIGLNGRLPWRHPEDLQWFKEQTMGKVVVCGANTAEHLTTSFSAWVAEQEDVCLLQ